MSKIFDTIANALTGKDQNNGPSGMEETENAPVVQEHKNVHQVEVVHPAVEKDIDQTIVHKSIQPIAQHQETTTHEYAVAEKEERDTEDVGAGEVKTGLDIESKTETEAGTHETVVEQPTVHENVHVHHVEDIQPVIKREVDHTIVTHVEKPIHEHHVSAPIVDEHVEVLPTQAF
jgi:hypothetical protein